VIIRLKAFDAAPFEKGGQGGFALDLQGQQQQQILPNPPFPKEGEKT
jgi:hypothetical protein